MQRIVAFGGSRIAWLLAPLCFVVACARAQAEPSPTTRDTPSRAPPAEVPAGAPTADHAANDPASTPCGKTGLPDCPLQGWMKANLQANLKSGDFARLITALNQLAAAEPKEFPGWGDSARAAAAAARSNDAERVRAECKNCHDRFRSKFRADMRQAKLP